LLTFYFIKLYQFDDYKELMSNGEIFSIIGGVVLGIVFLLAVSFAYFFGAGKSISKNMAPIIGNPELFKKTFQGKAALLDEFGLNVHSYLSGSFKLRTVRHVSHYRQDFLDAMFKRHHLAAIVCMLLAFIFLILVGFFLENKFFEMPAAASILVFFAVMIAFIGSLSYFMQSWSLPAAILIVIGINFLYEKEIIDPRNKAYGLNYMDKDRRPTYSKKSLEAMCSPEQLNADKKNMLGILQKWKQKQTSDKPLMVFINVSGGGLRSAAFVMNALQQLDSAANGNLMKQTFLISGASGGMLAATYYRELYRYKRIDPSLNIYDKKYGEYISSDLLNPVFTSMIARDIFAPIQKFGVDNNQYLKDRGYAFEKKLSDNTRGLLNIQLKDIAKDEQAANVPLIIFNSVVKADARKLLIGTQPMSFMMKPSIFQQDTSVSPDAVDFAAMFRQQQPMNLRVLTAMRMNATFPYVLPNVWLPSNPVIDVMDAGLRDNAGTETTLRFLDNFKDWIAANTSGVLLLQLRDRPMDEWEEKEPNSLTDMVVTPATMLQHNWFKLQGYSMNDQFSYFCSATQNIPLTKAVIMYQPRMPDKGATLNFHLSAREKIDIQESLNMDANIKLMMEIPQLLK
jgi:hypothetical protein